MKANSKYFTLRNYPEVVIPEYAASNYKTEALKEITLTDIAEMRSSKKKYDLRTLRRDLLDHADNLDIAIFTLENYLHTLEGEAANKEVCEMAIYILKKASEEASNLHKRAKTI